MLAFTLSHCQIVSFSFSQYPNTAASFFCSMEMEPTVPESFVKEGENRDEKVLELSLEDGGEIVKASQEPLISDAEWVCESPNAVVSSTASGWPSFDDIKSSSLAYTLSAEEQATVAVLQLQHKALEACQKFLNGDAGSDGDENDNDEDEDEDEDELIDNYDSKECEEYKFFEKLFAEDCDLRRYYVNNHRKGDFHCLVCGGIGKKVWKRFMDCSTLIHHSTAILRTRRKRAHRAYAQVICKVVGRDIDQLPAFVLKDLDSSLAGSKKLLKDINKLVEPGEHEKGSPQNVSKSFVKEGENLDGKVLESSSENGGEIVKASHGSLGSDAGWECKSPNARVSSTASGWPSFDDIKSSSLTYSLSAEEQATVAVLQLQHKALEACQKFLVGDAGSDGDEDVNGDAGSEGDKEDNDDEDEDVLVDNYDSKECKEYKFFEKLFSEDGDLRRYYENNHKEGDFYCLVCGGIKKKVWRRFKDCVALIQHSTGILRTTRMQAHRAYAQVICKVVGWDIDQLPAIVLKDLDSSLAGSRKLLGEPDNVTDNHTDD